MVSNQTSHLLSIEVTNNVFAFNFITGAGVSNIHIISAKSLIRANISPGHMQSTNQPPGHVMFLVPGKQGWELVLGFEHD